MTLKANDSRCQITEAANLGTGEVQAGYGDLKFDHGFLDFQVKGCTGATFNILLHGESDMSNFILRKYGPKPSGGTGRRTYTGATITTESIHGETVGKISYYIQDNGDGDSCAQTGYICDPAGPGQCVDDDGDGVTTCGPDGDPDTTADNDCDDTDPDEFPGQIRYKDADGDGYSDGTTQTQCEDPGATYYTGGALSGLTGDCDDTNNAMYTGNTEICDAYDNNCDGNTNE